MTLTRRQLIASAIVPAFTPALAQTAYPEKPLTIVIPFPPGGRTDLTGRLIAQHMTKHLGQSLVVMNKPGAGGAIGTRDVASAQPDGYTLGIFSTAVVTAQYTLANAVKLQELIAIRTVNLDPMAIAVRYDAPWKTLRELVDYGNKNPGKLKVGMIPGASAEIFAAAFANTSKIQVLPVPFKGDADGAIALAGGHIDAHVAVPASYKALVEGNKLRMIGLAAEQRISAYDVPTFRDNGVDLVIGSFHMLFVPARTPQSVVRVLETAADKAMREPELIAQMKAADIGYANMSTEESGTFLAQQDVIYRKVITDAGLLVRKS